MIGRFAVVTPHTVMENVTVKIFWLPLPVLPCYLMIVENLELISLQSSFGDRKLGVIPGKLQRLGLIVGVHRQQQEEIPAGRSRNGPVLDVTESWIPFDEEIKAVGEIALEFLG